MHQIYSERIVCNPEIIKSKLRIPNAKIKRFEMFLRLRRCIVPNVPIRACVGQLRKRHSRKCGTPIESISRRQNTGFRIYNVSLSPSLYQKKQFEGGLLSKWKYTYHFSIVNEVETSNHFLKMGAWTANNQMLESSLPYLWLRENSVAIFAHK